MPYIFPPQDSAFPIKTGDILIRRGWNGKQEQILIELANQTTELCLVSQKNHRHPTSTKRFISMTALRAVWHPQPRLK